MSHDGDDAIDARFWLEYEDMLRTFGKIFAHCKRLGIKGVVQCMMHSDHRMNEWFMWGVDVDPRGSIIYEGSTKESIVLWGHTDHLTSYMDNHLDVRVMADLQTWHCRMAPYSLVADLETWQSRMARYSFQYQFDSCKFNYRFTDHTFNDGSLYFPMYVREGITRYREWEKNWLGHHAIIHDLWSIIRDYLVSDCIWFIDSANLTWHHNDPPEETLIVTDRPQPHAFVRIS